MLALVVALLLAPPPLPESEPAAAEPQSAIQWEAPAGCPTQAEVEEAIADLAGRIPLLGELDARAVVESVDGVWTLRLEVVGDHELQPQRFKADDCQTLATAAALVVAVLLDPVATALSVVPSEPAEPIVSPEAEPMVASTSEPVRPEARSAPSRWRFGMHLEVGGEFGAVPRGTGGARIGLMVRRRRFEARAIGSYWLPRRTQPGSSPGARVQMGAAGLAACFVAGQGRFDVPMCAAIEGGAVRAVGVDVAAGRTAVIPWLAATVGPGVRWWLRPRFAFVASAEVFAPILRTRLTVGQVDDGRIVHDAAQAGFRGLVGVAVDFSARRDGSGQIRE